MNTGYLHQGAHMHPSAHKGNTSAVCVRVHICMHPSAHKNHVRMHKLHFFKFWWVEYRQQGPNTLLHLFCPEKMFFLSLLACAVRDQIWTNHSHSIWHDKKLQSILQRTNKYITDGLTTYAYICNMATWQNKTLTRMTRETGCIHAVMQHGRTKPWKEWQERWVAYMRVCNTAEQIQTLKEMTISAANKTNKLHMINTSHMQHEHIESLKQNDKSELKWKWTGCI